MTRMFVTGLVVTIAVALLLVVGVPLDAQKGGRGPKGPKAPPGLPKKLPGKGSRTFPALQVNDVKADGEYNLASLLSNGSGQPRLGTTELMAYRLVGYVQASHCLRFVTYEFAAQKASQFDVKLPKDVKPFSTEPRVASGGGEICIVSQQAQVFFVNMKDKKVVVVGEIDSKVPLKEAKPAKGAGRGKNKPKEGATPPTGGEYRVYGLPGGSHALGMLRNYDSKGKKYVSADATLYTAAGKSVTLKFDHDKYGVPPRGKDSVFGIKGEEVVMLATRPKKPGDFQSEVEISCLVFDLKTGALKDAQVCPQLWGGQDADTFMMSPTGDFFLAQPWGKYDRFVTRRGTWEMGYKTDYFDACVGFSADGALGLFLCNNTPERAFLCAIRLEDGKDVWRTTVTHEQAMGNGDDEPFTSVSANAKAVATQFGVIEGVTCDEAKFLFKNEGVTFEPICMCYDSSGKQVAVLALDRMFILDAKTRTETASISLEKTLPKGAQGEFIAFSKAGDKVVACVKGAGAWMFDIANLSIMATLPPIAGDHCRPLPDLSAVVYSASAADGGNLMILGFGQDKPSQLYRAEYEEVQAVCLWIDDKGESYLVNERGTGEGNLFLLNKKGEKTEIYSVKELEPRLVGDNAIGAFVTKGKNVVLVNDISEGGMTLLNCTVIEPGKDIPDPVTASFQCSVKVDELPGRSTYGATAASPYYAALWSGDDKSCCFACPAGVLSVDIMKSTFSLSAWSRKPVGVVALNPKSREFFVAGSTGLATYKFK